MVIGKDDGWPVFQQIAKGKAELSPLRQVVRQSRQHVLFVVGLDRLATCISLVELITGKKEDVRILLDHLLHGFSIGKPIIVHAGNRHEFQSSLVDRLCSDDPLDQGRAADYPVDMARIRIPILNSEGGHCRQGFYFC